MLHKTLKPFPDYFLWGASTSAYQVEGASLEETRQRTFLSRCERIASRNCRFDSFS